MNFQPRYLTIIGLSSFLLLTSCSDEQETVKPVSSESHVAQYKKDIAQASNSGLNLLVGEIAKKYPQLKIDELSSDLDFVAVDTELDKASVVAVRIPLVFNESLYLKKEAPEELDIMRKDINEAANNAMKPDAAYLMQIGMPTEMLRDEDRQAKLLPANLAELEQSLLSQTKGSVYVPMRQAGEVLELLVNIQLDSNSADGVKVVSIDYDEHKLDFMKDLVAESTFPTDQEMQIFSPEWLVSRKKTISDGIAAFNAEASSYIQSRETSARALWTERQTAIEEEDRAKQEEQFAVERAKVAAAQLYQSILTAGQTFQGEWKRDSRFGKLSLNVSKAELVENSIHFVGTLYDTDLPEASLDIVGHCDLSNPEEGAVVDVIIYDGQYDPDQATAEVYDAQDGVLRLKLDAKGQLTGVMTCDSWKNLKDKDFTVTMTAPLPEASQDDNEVPELP